VKLPAALLLLAASQVVTEAHAQPDAPAAAACPRATEVGQRHLLGLWRAQFEGLARGATLLLEPHPEFTGSVRGAINRDGERALVAGDVEDGEFTLEESVDGVNISATWTGTVEEDACGTLINGTWQDARDARQRAFVLRKQPASH
jgi:hypothetical protein